MSSLLEQAIADAEALKEAALKNAESLIIEKYSNEIQSAVNSILEQDDDEDLGLDDLDIGSELGGGLGLGDDLGSEEESDVLEQVPLAATGGEQLCACPEDGEQIEIDFDQLERDMEGGQPAEVVNRDDIIDDLDDEEEMYLEEDELSQLLENIQEDKEELEEEKEELEEENKEELEEEEELEEQLHVEAEPVSDGWNIAGQGAPEGKREYARDLALARAQDDQQKEQIKDLQSTVDKLSEELKTLKSKYNESTNKNKKLAKENQNLLGKTQKLIETVKLAKTKLTESSLSNARLFYSNKTLNNSSLNERQKSTIVEMLSRSESAGEAKRLYESLSSSLSVEQKSLKEAISKGSSVLHMMNKNNQEQKSPQKIADEMVRERMQKLAGIK